MKSAVWATEAVTSAPSSLGHIAAARPVGRLGLGNDAVPVMDDERSAARPSEVLRRPVAVADTHRAPCRDQPVSHPTSSMIHPLGSADEIEVLPVLIQIGPQALPRVVPRRPGW